MSKRNKKKTNREMMLKISLTTRMGHFNFVLTEASK